MATEEQPEDLDGPGIAATAALSTLVGATIGMLRVKGLLDRVDAAAIFSLADSLLPAASTPYGTEVIAMAKLASDRIVEDADLGG